MLESRCLLTGELDTALDTDGLATFTFPGAAAGEIRDVIVLGDGRIVLAGAVSDGTASRFALARLNANGSLDTSFGSGGFVTTVFPEGAAGARAIAQQSDGKFVVVGDVVGPDESDRRDFAIARYEFNGLLDTSFGGGDGLVTTDIRVQIGTDANTGEPIFSENSDDSARALDITPGGDIVVVGQGGPGVDWAISVYTSLGNPLKHWVKDFGNSNRADDVIIKPDGKILVAGVPNAAFGFRYTIQQFNGTEDSETLGTPDNEFGIFGGTTPYGGPPSNAGGESLSRVEAERVRIALEPDGRIIMAVMGPPFSPNPQFMLLRFLANGSEDTTFRNFDVAPSGLVTSNFAGVLRLADMERQADGKIVVAGTQIDPDGNLNWVIARFTTNEDGLPMLDPTFDGDGMLTLEQPSDELAFGTALHGDTLVVAGDSDGQPLVGRYLLTSGLSVSLTVSESFPSVGATIDVFLTVSVRGAPVGTDVVFEVLKADGSTTEFMVSTDPATGRATLSYSSNTAGTDTITARGLSPELAFAAITEVDWNDGISAITFRLLNPVNALGIQNVVPTFTTRDLAATVGFGDPFQPIPDAPLTFTVIEYGIVYDDERDTWERRTRFNDETQTFEPDELGSREVQTSLTDAAGTAVLRFASSQQELHVISARAIVGDQLYVGEAEVYWIAGEPRMELAGFVDDGIATVTARVIRDIGLGETLQDGRELDLNPRFSDVQLICELVTGSEELGYSVVETIGEIQVTNLNGEAVFSFSSSEIPPDSDVKIRVSGLALVERTGEFPGEPRFVSFSEVMNRPSEVILRLPGPIVTAGTNTTASEIAPGQTASAEFHVFFVDAATGLPPRFPVSETVVTFRYVSGPDANTRTVQELTFQGAATLLESRVSPLLETIQVSTPGRAWGEFTIRWVPGDIVGPLTGLPDEFTADLQFDPINGLGPAQIVFEELTGRGRVTMEYGNIGNELPPVPVNFQVVQVQDDGSRGDTLAYYDFHSTAEYVGGFGPDPEGELEGEFGRIAVTISYANLMVTNPLGLQILHLEDGVWQTSRIHRVDRDAQTITGYFPSLSPFAIAELIGPSEVTATLVGGTLQLVASEFDDEFELQLSHAGDTVTVMPLGSTLINGGNEPVTFTSVVSIDAQLLDGDDQVVTSGSAFSGSISISGGAGNDSLTGGIGNDRLDGGDGADVLAGGVGNDLLLGGTGNDVLSGGSGNDTINGDAGADLLREAADFNMVVTNASLLMTRTGFASSMDALSGIELLDVSGGVSRNRIDASGFFSGTGPIHTLIGGGAPDTIIGTNGRDRIITFSSGADSINGLGGNDTVFSGNGNDTVDGGSGDDWILGQDGTDSLLGNDGADMLFGNFGNDVLDGGSGADRLFGLQDHDVLRGGADNDSLFGDAGNDSLNGGAGNDLLRGSVGTDDLDGGAGAFDRMDEGGNTDFTIIGLQFSSPVFGTENARNIERFDLQGGPGNNRIDATRAGVAVILNGHGGNDTLAGGALADIVFGGDGDDILNGGAGNDRLEGGEGSDGLSGYLGNDSLFGQNGNDSLFGHDGADSLSGGDMDDTLVGGGGTPIEADQSDILDGGNGDDTREQSSEDTATNVEAQMAFANFPDWVDAI